MLQKREKIKNGVRNILLLVCGFAFFLILFYPASWRNPFTYFIELVKYMGHFPWDYPILYMGDIVSAHAVPWHYILVWIEITTPVPILIFFVYGLYKTILQVILDIRQKHISNTTYIYLGAFFIIFFPVVAAIAGNSTLYDGWRQFYFIYSAMLIITIAGIQSFYKTFIKGEKKFRVAGLVISAVCIIYFLYTSVWMIKNHPFQNVYFNFLAGKDPSSFFERDYWALSLNKGIEYVISHDKSDHIIVSGNCNRIKMSLDMINEKDAQRITCTDKISGSDYFIGYYRAIRGQYSGPDEVYSAKVDNFKIMSVMKLR
jgi:hypothetical protein